MVRVTTICHGRLLGVDTEITEREFDERNAETIAARFVAPAIQAIKEARRNSQLSTKDSK